MRRFHFYSRSPDNNKGVEVMDDVFEDHIAAWKGLCVVFNLEYNPELIRTMIARGYYCTTEAL